MSISPSTKVPRMGLPDLGYGIGLRAPHFPSLLASPPAVDWFEALTENYLRSQGLARHVLDSVAERYPVALHGVSLSIGGTDPLDLDYLARVKRLARETRAAWVSDHLCWTGVGGETTHDLLPLPLDERTLRHVIGRVRTVQDFLERPLVIENPSSYLEIQGDTLREWELLSALAEEADCGILLDVNNVYVSAKNHGFDPAEYIDSIPAHRVVQIHLAGHADMGTHLVDTHDGPVRDPVWALYLRACRRFPNVSTLVEWDAKIPPLSVLLAEVEKARSLAAGAWSAGSRAGASCARAPSGDGSCPRSGDRSPAPSGVPREGTEEPAALPAPGAHPLSTALVELA